MPARIKHARAERKDAHAVAAGLGLLRKRPHAGLYSPDAGQGANDDKDLHGALGRSYS